MSTVWKSTSHDCLSSSGPSSSARVAAREAKSCTCSRVRCAARSAFSAAGGSGAVLRSETLCTPMVSRRYSKPEMASRAVMVAMLAKGITMTMRTPSEIKAPADLRLPPRERVSRPSGLWNTAASTAASRSGDQNGDTTQRKSAVASSARTPSVTRAARGLLRRPATSSARPGASIRASLRARAGPSGSVFSSDASIEGSGGGCTTMK